MVYGGGGITPDYIVKSESITELTRDLLRKNVFYEFVLSYLDKKSESLADKYNDDLQLFRNEFEVDDDLIKEFINLAKSKSVEFEEELYIKDKQYIKSRLKAQIARNFWKNEGWYSVLLGIDNQMQKAVTLFGEAKNLANL